MAPLPAAPARFALDLDRPRTPPTQEEEGPASFMQDGVELRVIGLRRTSNESARTQLQELLNTLLADDPNGPAILDAIVIRKPDTRNILDYVYLSLTAEKTKGPRPDLLQTLAKHLNKVPGIEANWRVCRGPDKTRRVAFSLVKDKGQAEKLHEHLKAWLQTHAIEHQADYLTRPNSEIFRSNFEILKREDIDRIFKSPPVIDHVAYVPQLSRFIQPIFAPEIAIPGCLDWTSASMVLDRIITMLLGPDAILQSRMAADGQIYTVVLATPDLAYKLMQSDTKILEILAQDRITESVRIGKPHLLYHLNSNGLFVPREGESTSAAVESRFTQEFSLMRQQAGSQLGTLTALVDQQTQRFEGLQQGLLRTQQTFATIGSLHFLSHATHRAEARLAEARRDQNTNRLILAVAGQNLTPEAREALQGSLRTAADDAQQAEAEVHRLTEQEQGMWTTFQTSIAAIMPSPAAPAVLPPPIPETPPGLPPPSTSTEQPLTADMSTEDDRDEAIVAEQVCSTSSVPIPDPHLSLRTRASWEPELVPERELGQVGQRRGHLPRFLSSPNSPFHSVFSSSSSSFLNSRFLILAFLLLSAVSNVSAMAHNLQALSLNANGMANPMKNLAIANLISAHRPHVWAVCETKSASSVHDRIRVADYRQVESNGLPMHRSRAAKWGVILGVHSSLQMQPLELPSALCGRAAAADIIIPTTTGTGFTHRCVAVYAPWDPGTDGADAQSFWSHISTLCRSAAHSWTIIGDFNLTMAPQEATGNRSWALPSRIAYTAMLQEADGFDLWYSQGDASAAHSYTCRDYGSHSQSVIDRAALSRVGTITADITVLQSYIPGTDHRPIFIKVILRPPRSLLHATPHLPTSSLAPSYTPPADIPAQT